MFLPSVAPTSGLHSAPAFLMLSKSLSMISGGPCILKFDIHITKAKVRGKILEN